MNPLQMRQSVVGRWRVGGELQVLLGLWLMLGVCSLNARVFHGSLLVPVLSYGSETMIWRGNERSRIWAVEMDNLRSLMSIRGMDNVSNARIRQFCGVTKGVDENIDEGVLRWFGHVERMENDRVAKRVYTEEFAGSHSVSWPRKRWIDTVKDCLKKRGLDVRQTKIISHDRSVWRGFVRGNAWNIARGMSPWG